MCDVTRRQRTGGVEVKFHRREVRIEPPRRRRRNNTKETPYPQQYSGYTPVTTPLQ